MKMPSTPENSFAHEPTAEMTRRILAERAAALAKAPLQEDAAAEKIEIVEFMLAHEKYALETAKLREVHPIKGLTPLPGTPSFIKGIMNVRGQIIAIIDLRFFFDLPGAGLTNLNKAMIIDSPDFAAGFLADAVIGVRELPLTELQAALPTLSGIRAEYLKGVTRDRVAVLDVSRIIADEKLIVNDKVGAQAPINLETKPI